MGAPSRRARRRIRREGGRERDRGREGDTEEEAGNGRRVEEEIEDQVERRRHAPVASGTVVVVHVGKSCGRWRG